MTRLFGIAVIVCLALTTPVVTQADDANRPPATIPIHTKDNAPKTPALGDLPQADSITYCGVTWKFAAKVPVGRFVTGDYYVVGPATVVEISPGWDGKKNGSVLNLPVDNQNRTGFDKRASGNRYDANLTVKTPVKLKPGDALISSLSMADGEKPAEPFGGGTQSGSPVKSVSVLTCLEKPAPADAFRPSYCDRGQKLYLARDLQRDLLPRLKYGKDTYDWPMMKGIFAGRKGTAEDWAILFERPWMDVCWFGFDAPLEYQPGYGHIIARVEAVVSLILATELPQERKEKLLIGFTQYGIDLWGIARAGYVGWPGYGGHGSGRKFAIVLAGVLLGDDAMASPSKSCPKCLFGEDTQTYYGEGWTGAKALFGGHQYGKGMDYWLHKPTDEEKDGGPYEEKDPSTWNSWNNQSESYRRCCNVNAWVGYALVLQLMHLEKQWDHDAFFDYCDRWMYEDNDHSSKLMRERLEKSPDPYFHTDKFKAATSRSSPATRHASESFVQEMWDKYRPTDGWKKPHSAGGPTSGPAPAK